MFSKFNPFHLAKKVALLEKERDELLSELNAKKELLEVYKIELNEVKEQLQLMKTERDKAYLLCDKWFETVVGFGVNENTLITKSLHGQKLKFIPAP